MQLPSGFKPVRSCVLALAAFLGLVWSVLLSVEVFVLYDRSDKAQRNVVGVMIFIDALTSVVTVLLLILKFRVYLDAARVGFLVASHIGIAVLFTLFNPTFVCPEKPSERKVCHDVNTVILVCSWVLPALLVWYCAFLAVMYSMRETVREPSLKSAAPSSRGSLLPVMTMSERIMTPVPPRTPPMPQAPPRALRRLSRPPSTVPSIYSQVTERPPPPVPPLPPLPPLPSVSSLPSARYRPSFLPQQPPHQQPWQPPSLPPPTPAQPYSHSSSLPPSQSPQHFPFSQTMMSATSIPSSYSPSNAASVDSESRRTTLQLTFPTPQPPSSPMDIQSTPRSMHPAQSALLPIDETENRSPRSSGGSSRRLSKPAPLPVLY